MKINWEVLKDMATMVAAALAPLATLAWIVARI